MAKTTFRVVYEGVLDCGEVPPELVAVALKDNDTNDNLDGATLWEVLDPLELTSVEAVDG